MARKRQPKNPPGAVSGPGALSERTDLTPAGQPIRVAAGGSHGTRQQLEQQQAAAPLAVADQPVTASGGTPDFSGPSPMGDLFRPTERPGEPPVAGMTTGGPVPPNDPDALVRILHSIYPHPSIARLL